MIRTLVLCGETREVDAVGRPFFSADLVQVDRADREVGIAQMQESELEADLVPAFAAQLRRHIEIERGPFRRQRFRGELAARPQLRAAPREVQGGDANRSRSWRSPRPREPAATAIRGSPARQQKLSRYRPVGSRNRGRPPERKQPGRVGMPDRHAVGFASSDPALCETAEQPPFPRRRRGFGRCYPP